MTNYIGARLNPVHFDPEKSRCFDVSGEKIADSCFTCPLPVCKYDQPGIFDAWKTYQVWLGWEHHTASDKEVAEEREITVRCLQHQLKMVQKAIYENGLPDQDNGAY